MTTHLEAETIVTKLRSITRTRMLQLEDPSTPTDDKIKHILTEYPGALSRCDSAALVIEDLCNQLRALKRTLAELEANRGNDAPQDQVATDQGSEGGSQEAGGSDCTFGVPQQGIGRPRA